MSAVLYCVQCSLRCTPQDIQSWVVNSKRLRWEAAAVMVVIVLLYTLSHSAISILKIMSPSNEVRPLLLFIIACHSQERCGAVCLGDVFKKASLNEHI